MMVVRGEERRAHEREVDDDLDHAARLEQRRVGAKAVARCASECSFSSRQEVAELDQQDDVTSTPIVVIRPLSRTL